MRDANVYVICWMLIALWTLLYGHHKWSKGRMTKEGFLSPIIVNFTKHLEFFISKTDDTDYETLIYPHTSFSDGRYYLVAKDNSDCNRTPSGSINNNINTQIKLEFQKSTVWGSVSISPINVNHNVRDLPGITAGSISIDNLINNYKIQYYYYYKDNPCISTSPTTTESIKGTLSILKLNHDNPTISININMTYNIGDLEILEYLASDIWNRLIIPNINNNKLFTEPYVYIQNDLMNINIYGYIEVKLDLGDDKNKYATDIISDLIANKNILDFYINQNIVSKDVNSVNSEYCIVNQINKTDYSLYKLYLYVNNDYAHKNIWYGNTYNILRIYFYMDRLGECDSNLINSKKCIDDTVCNPPAAVQPVTTSQPPDTTSQPPDTTSQPPDTTSQPSDTTSQPSDTTSQPSDTTSQPSDTTTYSWQYGDWSKCSKPCGNETQTRVVNCKDSNNNDVNDDLCIANEKPVVSQNCNNNKCNNCIITVNDTLTGCVIPTDATSLPTKQITITGEDGCIIPSNIKQSYKFVDEYITNFEPGNTYNIYCNSYKYSPEFTDLDKINACKDLEFTEEKGQSTQFESECLKHTPDPISKLIDYQKPDWMNGFDVRIESQSVNCNYPSDRLSECPPPCAKLENTHYEFSQFASTGTDNTDTVMSGAHYWRNDKLRLKLVEILGQNEINKYEYIKDEDVLMITGKSCFKVDEWRSDDTIENGRKCLEIDNNKAKIRELIDPKKVTNNDDDGTSYINYFNPLTNNIDFINVDDIKDSKQDSKQDSNASKIAENVNNFFKNPKTETLKYIYNDKNGNGKRVLVVYTKTDKNECKPCESDTYYQSIQTLLKCRCPTLTEYDKINNPMLAENCRCGANFWEYDFTLTSELCEPYNDQ